MKRGKAFALLPFSTYFLKLALLPKNVDAMVFLAHKGKWIEQQEAHVTVPGRLA